MMDFLKILLIGAKIAFAINVEAPPEIAEQVLVYANEAAAGVENAILRVNIAKNRQCNAYILKLIDIYNGKTIKKIEFCSTELPNIELQNAVLEIFGRNIKNREEPLIGENGIMAIIGAGFAAAGLILYYSNPPQPVYVYKIREVKK
ncbi:MAG: hypothetical protein LBC75_00565 [Fibromonadaceae bacterium]|jgi:hypothetical protein|nr:hypothetical protein [Fibromonadaceae bacterium]